MLHCKAWKCLTWLVCFVLLETDFSVGKPWSSDGLRCPNGMYLNASNACVNCDCNLHGTQYYSNELPAPSCKAITGQCQCGPNVLGRTCDRCKPGTYDLNAHGCTDCWCVTEGAGSGICNEVTGYCKCKNDNIAGQYCDACRVGFCNYPVCEPCENVIGPAISKIPTTIVNATLDILRAFSFYIRPY
ncbi:laminin subunit beta-4-like [Paramacrobiotus metropolitanus]|uniref:laminin subunit beta-4-like n=1 Tax=Paramacrobiotus metropolitanus TaxID=2943436 RepID=UPI002445E525|nr:laminin subunit beta-4-like [Paramacrobiotus metropolitanus]